MTEKIKLITSGKLDKTGWKKVGKGAVIAASGAILTYVVELLPNLDFGNYTPIAVAIGGILVNAGWKWLGTYQSK